MALPEVKRLKVVARADVPVDIRQEKNQFAKRLVARAASIGEGKSLVVPMASRAQAENLQGKLRYDGISSCVRGDANGVPVLFVHGTSQK